MNNQEIVDQINELRKQKNYIESDKLRDLLIKSGVKIKLKDGIVILDTEIRFKKCGFCKKEVEKIYNCWIMREGQRTYGRPPNYFFRFPEFCKEHDIQPEHTVWETEGLITYYLCKECANKPYTLRHCKQTYNPIILGE
jgi:hypothetical protein